jgi:hypothetical protein
MPENEKKRWYDYALESLDFIDIFSSVFRFIFKLIQAFFEALL